MFCRRQHHPIHVLPLHIIEGTSIKQWISNESIQDRNLKCANESFSTMNRAIFKGEDKAKIIEKCIIPELHLLQSFVNHFFLQGLLPLLGQDNASKWPKKLLLVTKNYQEELFEGDACRKLMKNAEKLKSKDILMDLEEM